VDKINLLSKPVNPENFGNSVKNRFLEVAFCDFQLHFYPQITPIFTNYLFVEICG
jgi:hypothetical protein